MQNNLHSNWTITASVIILATGLTLLTGCSSNKRTSETQAQQVTIQKIVNQTHAAKPVRNWEYKPTVNLKNLTDSVMNGWRKDYQTQMQTLLTNTGCSNAVNITNLTNSVMNGWRADYQNQMSKLLDCTGCSSNVDLRNLTNSVMNGWRKDYEYEIGKLLSCSMIK